MSITARSSLKHVAFAVGAALRQAGLDATLTGGSCATIHTEGAYTSHDLDFVLRSAVAQTTLDEIMTRLGYRRQGAQYVHTLSRFFVEFIPGPIAVGDDAEVEPIELRQGASRILALSPTDACRDRLAAFYHWGDRPSLDVAVEIARRNPVDLPLIERWSRREGATTQFALFEAALPKRQGRLRPKSRPRRSRRSN